MKNLNFRLILSAVVLYSIAFTAATAKAAPVQFNQVQQVVNAKPGKAANGGFAQLRLADEPVATTTSRNGDEPKTDNPPPPQQDDRVITETRAEIVEDDVCDCLPTPPTGKGFPYAYLALGAVPLFFLIPHDKDETPTPTLPPPTTSTPTPTTPTPPTEPVPEPMTILLFGTGLASIGLAARRKFGKKDEQEEN